MQCAGSESCHKALVTACQGVWHAQLAQCTWRRECSTACCTIASMVAAGTERDLCALRRISCSCAQPNAGPPSQTYCRRQAGVLEVLPRAYVPMSEVLEGSPLCYIWLAARNWDALLTSTAGTEQMGKQAHNGQEQLTLSSTRDIVLDALHFGSGERRQLLNRQLQSDCEWQSAAQDACRTSQQALIAVRSWSTAHTEKGRTPVHQDSTSRTHARHCRSAKHWHSARC